MSQKNDETTGAIMILALIGTVFWIAFLFVYALLAFLAIVLTVLSFIAWNKKLTIGSVTIEPHEARLFVWRGVMGAGLLPMFVGFMSMLFDAPLRSDLTIHLFIAGYTAGSVGIEMWLVNNGHYATPTTSPAPPQLPSAPPKGLAPPRQAEPFRYASWDDEEEQK